MQRKFAHPAPEGRIPTTDDMRRVWRGDRCVQDSSAATYLNWIRRFRAYCQLHELDERSELTLEGARYFIAWYARRRHLDPRCLNGARTAVYALSRVYAVMGQEPPTWHARRRARPPATMLLQAFADHLLRLRGNPEVTVRKQLDHAGKLLEHLAQHGKTWETMTLSDLDAFLIECAGRYARATTAGIACSVRTFARFLLATGRVAVDLADAVISPVQPKFERPRRALPWSDVQRLLRAVDTSSGRRQSSWPV
jgi:integrase